MSLTILACCLLAQALTPEVVDHAKAGTEARQRGQFDVAIREFRAVTELQPKYASGHANLGDAYFLKGDYDAAVAELKRALQINPNLMGTHQTLGVALLVQGNPEEALPHLEKTRTPQLLGLAYLETGRLGSAIVALHAALEAQPNDADLLYYFGRATALAAQRTRGQLARINPIRAGGASEAEPPAATKRDVVELQKELATRPTDPDLLYVFSEAAASASKQAFEQVLQAEAGSARAHQIRGERLLASGRIREAEKEYSQALELKPYTAGVHLALGEVYAAALDWPAAIAQWRAEAQLRPTSADPHYRIGEALLRQGESRGAIEEFALADTLKPGQPRILFALGKAASAAHESARAEASFRRLLTIEMEGDWAALAHFELAALYRQAGNEAEAARETAAYEQLQRERMH
jgi:tetratricopeptide (TPR) repeat protein